MKTNMKKHILGGLLMVAAGTAFTACSSDFLDTQPTDRVGTDLVWSTYNMANAVVNGAYERFYYENGYETPDWQNFDAATDVCDLDANWSAYAVDVAIPLIGGLAAYGRDSMRKSIVRTTLSATSINVLACRKKSVTETSQNASS